MKDFKKYYIVGADPEMVYKALTNAATIQLWSGSPAVMEPLIDTEFSLWEGSICGRNIEFIPFKKIVQEWYFGEQENPSIVTFLLHEDKKGCSVELRHTNIPDEEYDNITSGWTEMYFASLISFYAE
jgi:activator of HSP90 ATPase